MRDMPGPTKPDDLTVSVVICAYTFERLGDIAEAVASLEAQRRLPRQIILVIDNNEALFEKCRLDFPQCLVLRNSEAKGHSGGRNTGLKAATSDIVAFIDDDAVPEPDWLQNSLPVFADEKALGTGAFLKPIWRGKRPAWFPEEFLWTVACTYRGAQMGRVRNLIGAAMCFRKSVFTAVGSFDYRLGRDGSSLPISADETEFCMRAAHSVPGGYFCVPEGAVVAHKVHAIRLTWGYFLKRCYAEGISKGRMAAIGGSASDLSVERSYAVKVLGSGILHGLRDGLFKGDLGGLGRAGAIAAGFSTTAAGFVITLFKERFKRRN